MFKKGLSVLLVASIVMLSSVITSSEEKVDSFQQVMNYLVTGDPFNNRTHSFPAYESTIHEAVIFDRKNCIAGWKDNMGGSLKIHWNAVDVNAIRIQDKFINNTVWVKYISLSGKPFIADVEPRKSSLNIPQPMKGILKGKYLRVYIPLGKTARYDDERLVKALQLLYSKHCTGAKRKSAF